MDIRGVHKILSYLVNSSNISPIRFEQQYNCSIMKYIIFYYEFTNKYSVYLDIRNSLNSWITKWCMIYIINQDVALVDKLCNTITTISDIVNAATFLNLTTYKPENLKIIFKYMRIDKIIKLMIDYFKTKYDLGSCIGIIKCINSNTFDNICKVYIESGRVNTDPSFILLIFCYYENNIEHTKNIFNMLKNVKHIYCTTYPRMAKDKRFNFIKVMFEKHMIENNIIPSLDDIKYLYSYYNVLNKAFGYLNNKDVRNDFIIMSLRNGVKLDNFVMTDRYYGHCIQYCPDLYDVPKDIGKNNILEIIRSNNSELFEKIDKNLVNDIRYLEYAYEYQSIHIINIMVLNMFIKPNDKCKEYMLSHVPSNKYIIHSILDKYTEDENTIQIDSMYLNSVEYNRKITDNQLYKMNKKIKKIFNINVDEMSLNDIVICALDYLYKNNLLLDNYFIIDEHFSNIFKMDINMVLDINQLINVMSYSFIVK